MNNPIPIAGIDHIVLRVDDVEPVLAFYIEVLRCPLERRNDEIGLIQLRAGDALIDIVPVDSILGRQGGGAPGDDSHNQDHFCLKLRRFNEDEILGYLAQHGVETDGVGRRYGADGYGPSIYIKDPAGNTVELKGPSGQ